MSMVASLQDFRQQGPPADIGTFLFPAEVIVYLHDFGGVTFVCAAQRGNQGWTLLAHLPLTAANASTVINAALAGLTPGRTWKEKVIVMGNLTVLVAILVYSYTILEILGKSVCIM